MVKSQSPEAAGCGPCGLRASWHQHWAPPPLECSPGAEQMGFISVFLAGGVRATSSWAHALSTGEIKHFPLFSAVTRFSSASYHDVDNRTRMNLPLKLLRSWELEGSQSYLTE